MNAVNLQIFAKNNFYYSKAISFYIFSINKILVAINFHKFALLNKINS